MINNTLLYGSIERVGKVSKKVFLFLGAMLLFLSLDGQTVVTLHLPLPCTETSSVPHFDVSPLELDVLPNPTSGELTLESEYAAAPSLRDDLFKLYLQDGTLNIQNISGKDLDGSIVVYYKGADENGFFGGITYRLTIDGLKKDSIAQRHSEHIGEVVNITYGE